MEPHIEDWARNIWVANLANKAFMAPPELLNHPQADQAIRCITDNHILCAGLVESFSKEMPHTANEDLLPIDILFGAYSPVQHTITIFIDSIRKHASRIGATPAELTHIVRVHEYAHAIVHLGIPFASAEKEMLTFDGDLTAWHLVLNRRTCWFKSMKAELHELLAQALTYGVLQTGPNPEKMIGVFEELEKKQPAHYQLSKEVKLQIANADWPMILNAARGENSAADLVLNENDLVNGIRHLILCPSGSFHRP